ncbi:hypothetical protein [Lewinella sp. LCG006]|uniref:hypothetical protein n=1 Tax=Lewinella sp. LCG006 TaxID=3231911 RepID=UPI003461594E
MATCARPLVPTQNRLHLYNEEREDFRQRVKLILEDPTQPLPAIDAANWVLERAYLQHNTGLDLNYAGNW